MTVLVSDSSVLIDLERGVLLKPAFQLGEELAVPDVLYERELRDYNGPELVAMGLRVMVLEPEGVLLATDYRLRRRAVSLPDSFALALARTGGHLLLTGDSALRSLAGEERVECHGVLWVLDRIETAGLLRPADLEAALSAITAHPRSRLPEHDVRERIIRYRAGRP